REMVGGVQLRRGGIADIHLLAVPLRCAVGCWRLATTGDQDADQQHHGRAQSALRAAQIHVVSSAISFCFHSSYPREEGAHYSPPGPVTTFRYIPRACRQIPA